MPKWSELSRFCERDGWELYKNTDHKFYRKRMPNGMIKRTKVSNGSSQIGKSLWKEILNKQLQVSQEYFDKKI